MAEINSFSGKELSEIVRVIERTDKTKILSLSRIDEVAALFYVAEQIYGLDLADHSVFEAGNHVTGRLDSTFQSSAIPFFFANHLLTKYTGYDSKQNSVPKISSNLDEDLNDYFAPMISKARAPLKFVEKTMKSQQSSSYEDFVEKINGNSFPIIFSTYVLGDPELDKAKPFWKLKGLHIHIGVVTDFHRDWFNIYKEQSYAHYLNQGPEPNAIPKDFVINASEEEYRPQWDKLLKDTYGIENANLGFMDNKVVVYYKK